MPAPKGTIPWNAGTGKGWHDKRGYHWIYVTENGRRRAKRAHRHIMEQHLGRSLQPTEIVHHKDGNPRNNDLKNLEIVDWSEHTKSHSTNSCRSDMTKKTQQVFANFREDNLRLLLLNHEILEALRESHEVLHSLMAILPSNDGAVHAASEAMVKARAAIAKAEGRE